MGGYGRAGDIVGMQAAIKEGADVEAVETRLVTEFSIHGRDAPEEPLNVTLWTCIPSLGYPIRC